MVLLMIAIFSSYTVRKGKKDKILTPSEYLDMIRPYLSDIIHHHKTHGE